MGSFDNICPVCGFNIKWFFLKQLQNRKAIVTCPNCKTRLERKYWYLSFFLTGVCLFILAVTAKKFYLNITLNTASAIGGLLKNPYMFLTLFFFFSGTLFSVVYKLLGKIIVVPDVPKSLFKVQIEDYPEFPELFETSFWRQPAEKIVKDFSAKFYLVKPESDEFFWVLAEEKLGEIYGEKTGKEKLGELNRATEKYESQKR